MNQNSEAFSIEVSPSIKIDPRRRSKILITVTCLIVFWTLARFGTDVGSVLSGWSNNTVRYIASPKNGFERINVREGPGTEFRVSREVDRGAIIVGGEKRQDQNGQFWIVLKDGGFVKETVLIETN